MFFATLPFANFYHMTELFLWRVFVGGPNDCDIVYILSVNVWSFF